MSAAWKAAGLTYNRYLAIAARAVRRSLKEENRLASERRGEMDLRIARWSNGKQGDPKDLAKANAAAMAESAPLKRTVDAMELDCCEENGGVDSARRR